MEAYYCIEDFVGKRVHWVHNMKFYCGEVKSLCYDGYNLNLYVYCLDIESRDIFINAMNVTECDCPTDP